MSRSTGTVWASPRAYIIGMDGKQTRQMILSDRKRLAEIYKAYVSTLAYKL